MRQIIGQNDFGKPPTKKEGKAVLNARFSI
jgi:hypothetical protein